MNSKQIYTKQYSEIILLSILLLTICSSSTGYTQNPITIRDLVTYMHIENTALSPDGKWAAYLLVKPNIETNDFTCSLYIQQTQTGSPPTLLAQYTTEPKKTFDAGGSFLKTAGSLLWSPDSKQLAYTKPAGNSVQLLVRTISEGKDTLLTNERSEIALDAWPQESSLLIYSIADQTVSPPAPDQLTDPAIRITEEHAFKTPPWFVKPETPPTPQPHAYDFAQGRSLQISDADVARYTQQHLLHTIDHLPGYGYPTAPTPNNWFKTESQATLAPDKSTIAFIGNTQSNLDIQHLPDTRDEYFIGLKSLVDNRPPTELTPFPGYLTKPKWDQRGQNLYFISITPQATAILSLNIKDHTRTELFTTPDRLTDVSWSDDARTVLAVRQTNYTPDELVKVDLTTKTISTLRSPNESFQKKDHPTIRFMKIDNPLGGRIFGRLVLPNDFQKGKRYPLVFTLYRAGAGFLEGATGEEFPIFPLAARGFAVFALDTGSALALSLSGDHAFTLIRLKRPLEAMDIIIKQLDQEGIIDPQRAALGGLSYGADIASYAIWASNLFRAASIASSNIDPFSYTLLPLNRSQEYERAGFHYPDENGRPSYKTSSLALNAATLKTPLLIQSPDTESMYSIATFKALKHYGVPIDWYVYPNEGHVKVQPITKYFVYERNIDWFSFWLKDEIDPASAKREQYASWKTMRDNFEKRKAQPSP